MADELDKLRDPLWQQKQWTEAAVKMTLELRPQLTVTNVIVYGQGRIPTSSFSSSFGGKVFNMFGGCTILQFETMAEAQGYITAFEGKVNYILWDATDPARVVCVDMVQ